LSNFGYAPGGHSAALKEHYWDSLGDFVLTGIPNDDLLPAECKQKRLAEVVGKFPFVAWSIAMLVGIALAFLFGGIAYGLGAISNGSIDFLFGAATVAFFWAFVTILRKV